jgi:hypothetical protein
MTSLRILGDPAAAACEGDFCEIPEQNRLAVVRETDPAPQPTTSDAHPTVDPTAVNGS